MHKSTFYRVKEKAVARGNATDVHPLHDYEESLSERGQSTSGGRGWLPDRANCEGPIGPPCAVTPKGRDRQCNSDAMERG